MQKKIIFCFTLFLFILSSACSPAKNPQGVQTSESEKLRVVSLVPSNTEITAALGALDLLVGVTSYCDYPEEVKQLPSVGFGTELNAEAVLALNPDIVLASDMEYFTPQSAVDLFEKSGIKVVKIPSLIRLKDIDSTIVTIADAIGKPEEAKIIIAEINAEFDKIAAASKGAENHPKVYLETSPLPDMFTIGSDSYLQDLIELSGGINIFADQKGDVRISEEQVIDRNPDVILLTYGHYIENPIDEVVIRSAWQNIAAVKNGRIYDIDSNSISRPSPRLIQGAWDLARAISPELYP